MEQKQANQEEIKQGFSLLDKETYGALPLTRWLNKSRHPIPGQPQLPVERSGGFGSVATFKPASTGNLSYEHKEPLIAGKNGASHT